jgi:thymidylate kinase
MCNLHSRVIVFAGTVGAGKSTQMIHLGSKLKANRLKVKTASLKSGHLFAYFLETTVARILTGRKDVYPLRALIEEQPHLFKKLFSLWLVLDLISISIKFLLNIYVPIQIGYVVLVEEYIPATLADYVYLTKAIGLSKTRVLSFALNFLPRLMHLADPTQIIFLDAPPDTLKSRWQFRMSPDEKSDYIFMQRKLLLSICRDLSSKFSYIDTNEHSSEETRDLVLDHIIKETC